MKQDKITGIVIKCQNMFEKDRLIELFTPTHGKIKLLAKYANTKSFKFGGKLEVGNVVTCNTYQGRSFTILTQCDLIENFANIRLSFNTISICLYIIDIIKNLTSYEQINENLYALLYDTLTQLNNTPEDLSAIKQYFHQNILKVEGLLNDPNTPITDHKFQSIFESYSGRKLKEPLVLKP